MTVSAHQFRDLTQADLPAAHQLLAAGLALDRFSPDLLREKLFGWPAAAGVRPRVLGVESGGALVACMQVSVKPDSGAAWLGLFAVEGAARRQRLAAALWDRAEAWLRESGARQVDLLGGPGNYFAPGLDPRYTAALAFVERRGFERCGDCVNLRADLRGDLATAADVTRLAEQGIAVRRAAAADAALLDAYFDEHFGAGWRLEARLALDNDPPGLHIALRDERVFAFAAHSSQNREWGFFGPMGTAPEARGSGVGRVLLLRCLQDLKDAGHDTAIIPWVGPIVFYARCVPCRVERVYWRYRKLLEA